MKKKLIVCLCLGLLAASFSGCELLSSFGFGPKKSGKVLARVGGEVLTLEDFNRDYDDLLKRAKTLNLSQEEMRSIESRESKIRVVEAWIQKELLAQEAMKKGLLKNKDVERALANLRKEILMNKLLEDEASKTSLSVTDDEIRTYYDRVKERYRDPTQIKAREIVTKTEEEALGIYLQIRQQGGSFSQLAQERSIAASKDKGGDLGTIVPGQKSPEFDRSVFPLEPGAITKPFQGADGLWYVVKIEEKKVGKEKSVHEIWDQLKAELTMLKQ